MKLRSGSGWQRLAYCIGEAILLNTDEVNPWAGTGTSIHAFFHNAATLGREKALSMAPEAVRSRCAAVDLESMPMGGKWKSEVAFTYDVLTEEGSLLGRGLERAYGEGGDTELPITLDACCFDEECFYYVDTKTGRHGPHAKE